MVVAYRMSPVSYTIARILNALGMVKGEFISLPNVLAGRRLVPELIQGEATAEAIGQDMLHGCSCGFPYMHECYARPWEVP